MYLIPKELKSRIKITKYFHLKEFLMFIGAMCLVFLFENRIHSSLKYIYYLFYALTIAFLLSNSKSNPQRNNLQVLIYTLKKDNQKYYSFNEDFSKEL